MIKEKNQGPAKLYGEDVIVCGEFAPSVYLIRKGLYTFFVPESELEFEEDEFRNVSDCCEVEVIYGDICSACREHCDTI